ncbi:hypothetical protein CCACVL1_08153, partial [Corchorus capsularis]
RVLTGLIISSSFSSSFSSKTNPWINPRRCLFPVEAHHHSSLK